MIIMDNVLAKICEKKQEYISLCKQKISLTKITKQAEQAPHNRGFIAALDNFANQKKYALIAEIKKASPSEGIIKSDFNPSFIAKEYEQAGACCLSVLTETDFFLGSDDYLLEAKKASKLPILRKDFMLDSYQVIEAKAIGTDAILLIMAILSDDKAKELENEALKWGLDVLIEIHNEEELKRALKLKSPLIGINNRDLKTLKTNIATTEKLAKLIPSDKKIVSESGLYTSDDLKRMANIGVYRFLIGHSLMKSENIFETTKKLLTQEAN